jgi:hypothetical protein
MKIGCSCGEVIRDQSDDLPDKAHLVPDEIWFTVFDRLDSIIGDAVQGRMKLEDAQRAAMQAVWDASRPIWQCRACGRIYIENPKRDLGIFVPASETEERMILRNIVRQG